MELDNNIEDIVITNLDYLLSLEIFKWILNWNISELNIDDFTKKFNDFFFNSWDYWYDDANKINIDTSSSYTKEQVEKYISAVKKTLNLSNDNIEIRKFKKVPYTLALELYEKVWTNSSDLKKWDISFWIFKWNEVIWYINWDFWDLGLSVLKCMVV